MKQKLGEWRKNGGSVDVEMHGKKYKTRCLPGEFHVSFSGDNHSYGVYRASPNEIITDYTVEEKIDTYKKACQIASLHNTAAELLECLREIIQDTAWADIDPLTAAKTSEAIEKTNTYEGSIIINHR